MRCSSPRRCSTLNPVEIDEWEKLLDRCIRVGKCDLVIRDWAPVALSLKQSGTGEERIQSLKAKLLRCHDIMNELDMPDPKPVIPADLTTELRERCIEKNDRGGEELDWHLAAQVIAKHIHFVSYVDGEKKLLYYDPSDGTWKPGAEELITKVAREAFRNKMSRYMREEIVADLQDTNYVFADEPDRPGEVLNLMNGVLEIASGKLMPHSPDFHFRNVLPVRYNPRAVATGILRFLEEATEDDLNKALRILEGYAYCLMPGYPIQKIITLLGNGNNGKSIALGILTSFLGKKNIATIPLQELSGNRFARKNLRHTMANVSGDVNGGFLQDTSIIKQLTGGDYTDGETKFQQERAIWKNDSKLLYAFNQLPVSRDMSKAFYRRFELIQMLMDFTGREDKNLLSKLTTGEELSGLLNLLTKVFIPALTLKEEFHDPMTVEEIRLVYNLSANPALAFIQEHVRADPEGQIVAMELYNHMVNWCKERGVSPPKPESFGYTLIQQSGIFVQNKRVQENNVRTQYYVGIRYVEELDLEIEETAVQKHEPPFPSTPHTIIEALRFYYSKYLDKYDGAVGAFFNHYMTRASIMYRFEKPTPPQTPTPLESGCPSYEDAATVQMAFSQDINIAYFDRDLVFHAQDIAFVPPEWVGPLIKKGVARVVGKPPEDLTGAKNRLESDWK